MLQSRKPLDAHLFPPRESPLANAARPLLQLVQSITGMDSTFVTSIDWVTRQQTILYSRNGGDLELTEGGIVDWQDSMCRSLFLSGVTQSADIGVDVATTAAAEALGMKSFFALPILVDDVAIGTVCGASKRKMALGQLQLERVQLIADALQQLLEVEREKAVAQARADWAEKDAAHARLTAERHAVDLVYMKHLAHTDVLTELPNRRAFMARWEDELARSGRRRYPIGLMLIDADHFKKVNDTGGHAMGDAVLRAISATLREVTRTPDVVARLGGDEFALVTTHADDAQLRFLAETIQQRFSVVAAELEVSTTLSIGLASSEHCPLDTLLGNADRALYQSKAAGGNAVRMFVGDSTKHANPDTGV